MRFLENWLKIRVNPEHLATAMSPHFPMRRECPFALPEELRRRQHTDPIARVTLWDGSTPWLVTRYEDVRAVLLDQRFSADSSRPGYPAISAVRTHPDLPPLLNTMDDPDHARYRRTVIADFTVRGVEKLRPFVTETVDDLLDAMAARQHPVDLVTAFALPLSSTIICHVLGVPDTDHEFFQERSHTLQDLDADPGQAERAGLELLDYLRDLTVMKESEPGEDLISRLMVRVHAAEMSRADVIALSILLLIAGHETTANMISLGTLALLRHPDQAAVLRDTEDPATTRAAVEELLRLLSIATSGRRRVATEDVELGGVLIRAGEGVIAATDSANHDPAVFDRPDELDIHRRGNNHVAFGFGVHQCLGHQLARMTLQIAYPALLRRFPTLRVAITPDEIVFLDEMPDYGVRSLPVSW